jgi:TonB family protein
MKAHHARQGILIYASLISLALVSSASSLTGDALLPSTSGAYSGEPAGQRYHVRLMRARFGAGEAGSALFKPEEFVVPLSGRESWGSRAQVESLKRALGAEDIEPIPGLIVAAGPTESGEPHRLRTALGGNLIDILVLAEEAREGWHRIRLIAEDDSGTEILDAGLQVEQGETVAVVAGIPDKNDAIIVGFTPMANRVTEAAAGIVHSDSGHVTKPVLIQGTKVMPVYPEIARKSYFDGKVVLEAVVRTDGVPDGIVIVEMPEGGEHLAGSAVEAISQWRYRPARLYGEPVDVFVTIMVEYRLE